VNQFQCFLIGLIFDGAAADGTDDLRRRIPAFWNFLSLAANPGADNGRQYRFFPRVFLN